MKINIPSSTNDIKVRQYNEWVKVPDDMPEAEKEVLKVAIFCDIDILDARNLKAKDFRELSLLVNIALDTKPTIKDVWTFKGVKFKLVEDFNKITQGEYIDGCKYSVDDYSRFLAVFFRVVKGKSIVGYKNTEDTYKIMNEAPLTYLLDCMGFFLHFHEQHKTNTRPSMAGLVIQRVKVLASILLNGGGFHQCIRLLKGNAKTLDRL